MNEFEKYESNSFLMKERIRVIFVKKQTHFSTFQSRIDHKKKNVKSTKMLRALVEPQAKRMVSLLKRPNGSKFVFTSL